MSSKKVKNVFTSVKPLYYYLKILGLFHLSIDENFHKETLKKSLKNKILSTIPMWTLTGLLSVFIKKSASAWTSSLVLTYAYSICSLFGYFLAWFLILYQLKNTEKILEILKMLYDIDQKVNEFKITKLFLFFK